MITLVLIAVLLGVFQEGVPVPWHEPLEATCDGEGRFLVNSPSDASSPQDDDVDIPFAYQSGIVSRSATRYLRDAVISKRLELMEAQIGQLEEMESVGKQENSRGGWKVKDQEYRSFLRGMTTTQREKWAAALGEIHPFVLAIIGSELLREEK